MVGSLAAHGSYTVLPTLVTQLWTWNTEWEFQSLYWKYEGKNNRKWNKVILPFNAETTHTYIGISPKLYLKCIHLYVYLKPPFVSLVKNYTHCLVPLLNTCWLQERILESVISHSTSKTKTSFTYPMSSQVLSLYTRHIIQHLPFYLPITSQQSLPTGEKVTDIGVWWAMLYP